MDVDGIWVNHVCHFFGLFFHICIIFYVVNALLKLRGSHFHIILKAAGHRHYNTCISKWRDLREKVREISHLNCVI